MDVRRFANTWNGIHSFNNFLRVVVICLIVTNIVSVFGWIGKDQLVLILPPNTNEKVEISRMNASQSYKKAWALFIASLLGNINPENAEFIKASLANMVTGEIKLAMNEQIAMAIEQLKQEKVSAVFEVRQVIYEPETDHVFVAGHTNLVGAGGKTNTSDQTYEFKIDVNQYSPLITYLSIYTGGPKTAAVLAVEREKEESIRKQAANPNKP